MLENFDDFLKEMKQTNSEFKDYDEGYFKFKLETISGLLKSERIKKKMTQKELAIKINTHPQVISRIENNPMNLRQCKILSVI